VRGDAVQAENLSRRFRAASRWRSRHQWFTALDHLSVTVPAGAVFGILGHNGAGKTTFFEILTTLLLPHGGRATVFGHDVVAEAHHVRRLVAYVPSGGTGFFPRLTGRQNLEYFAALCQVPSGAWRSRTEDAARQLNIADALDRRLDQYSDGMRQRLGLARALLTTAPLWILDEPTRGLDPHSRALTQQLIRSRVREHATTVLMSTHDLDEAARICDHVIVLHRGRVTLDAPTSALRADPEALSRAYGIATEEAPS
jgi:ABC-2 type transport system ATP-binding protein